MVQEANLFAQHAGLVAVEKFMMYSPDFKNVINSNLNFILDKISHKKQNFRDSKINIVLMTYKSEMGHHLLSELLRRFKSAKNADIIEFCVEVVTLIIRKYDSCTTSNLRQIFNATLNTFGHHSNKIRNAGVELLTEIYSRISDDLDTVMKKLRKVREALRKEIKKALQKTSKLDSSQQHRIFEAKTARKESGDEDVTPEKPRDNHEKEEMKVEEFPDESNNDKEYDNGKIELVSLVCEDFDKTPYEVQITKKKEPLVDFYGKLKQAYHSGKEISKGDNSKVYKTLDLMLQDTNALILLESLKILELLCLMKDPGIKGKYATKYAKALFDKFKETKTAVLVSIRNCLDAFIQNEIIPIDSLINIALNFDPNKSMKTKKVIVSTSKSKANNPRTKQNALEFINENLKSLTKTLNEGRPLSDVQSCFCKGVFDSHFEKPLLNMLLNETSNSVREEAFNFLKEVKRLTGLVQGVDIQTDRIDEIISKLPKKCLINQIIQELNLTEKVIEGKQRYLFEISEYDEKPVKGTSKSKLKEPTAVPKKKSSKKKDKKKYKLDPEVELQLKQQLGDSDYQEFKQVLELIQNISGNKGISAKDVEDLLTEFEITKMHVIDCIKFNLLNNIPEVMLENPDYEIPESLALIVKKVLSLSKNTTDGEMIHNLIIILLVISAYTTEPKASSLATSIFNS